MKKLLKYPKPSKRIKKLRRVRKTPIATLERKTWIIFSKYIRMRDAKKAGSLALDWLKCYTCGKDILVSEAHAGHFIHDKNIVKFDEKVVHGQCDYCNTYKRGNLAFYTLHMIKDYGQKEVERLLAIKTQTHKFKREELEKIRRDCALKISKLMV